ncbi:MAG TPA: hypothetical protein GXZ52_00570 [Clostridiales bacterium]|jgi:uncharacterized protein (DUF1810 family)|nr:hypothetical protein [Clostridiales bacterium]
MNLDMLSKEYRECGEKCRAKLKQLEQEIVSDKLTESQRLILRRKLTILSDMARETIAISNYLKHYYQGACKYDDEKRQGVGISGSKEVLKVH